MANFSNDAPPRTRTVSFFTVVRRALRRQPIPEAYLFSGVKRRKGSSDTEGIYAYNILLGSLFEDLTANDNATLTIVNLDSRTRVMLVLADAGAVFCQAQVLVIDLVPKRQYALTIYCHTNSVAAAGRIAVYDGSQLAFAQVEPTILAEIADVGSLTGWTKKELLFTPLEDRVTIGLESKLASGSAWFDINTSKVRQR